MTATKRRWLWFLGIYIASLSVYAASTLLVRTLVKFAF